MHTTQVQELTADLGEIARKYAGRDLTKAAIVELFTTEAAVIAAEEPALASVHRHLVRAVETTAGMPQTVDQDGKPRSHLREDAKARRRLAQALSDAADDAGEHLDPRTVAKYLIETAQVVLDPDDNPIPQQHQRAYQLTKQVLAALDEGREAAA